MKSVTSTVWRVAISAEPATRSGFVTRYSILATRYSPLAALLLLAACAGTPPPDWQTNATGLLERYQKRWLEGESRPAELSFAKAQAELGRTGRLDLAARAELIRCATQIAGLDFAPCSGYRAADATPSEAAYARLLAGEVQDGDPRLLPEHYAAYARAKDAGARNRAAQAMTDPFARLLASALLLKAGEIVPETIGLANRTASEQGWRRALLAWLHVQAKRAEAAGDTAALAHLQRQIEFASRAPHQPEAPATRP